MGNFRDDATVPRVPLHSTRATKLSTFAPFDKLMTSLARKLGYGYRPTYIYVHRWTVSLNLATALANLTKSSRDETLPYCS